MGLCNDTSHRASICSERLKPSFSHALQAFPTSKRALFKMSSLAATFSKLLRTPTPFKMSSLAATFSKLLRTPTPGVVGGMPRSLLSRYCTASFNDDNNSDGVEHGKNTGVEEGFDDFIGKPELQLQGVDPRKGWGFRGVHKAIICGKVGQAPVQKILRNGRTITIFTVGTGGMFDQRIVGANDVRKPAQWHRVAVHNELLGIYAVQQLAKNSSVYVEGDIETRVYNDSINGEVKNIPEICIRRDGKIRLIKSGEIVSNISFEDLRQGLFD